MYTRACFVILCCITLTFALNEGEQGTHIVPKLCKYTNFCHTDAREIMPTQDKVPCCFPCSCDDDCWDLDNCCPDKELINGPRPPIVPCIDSYVKPPNTYEAGYTGFYRVIDSCPSSEGRSNVSLKCNGENRTSLEDFVWVSDITGRIYQNIHCAECNEIKETIPWQIKTTCYDIMRANFGDYREMLISEKCSVLNNPPDDLKTITDRYTCLNPKRLRYSSCNETGLMAHYDPDVESACKQSTWPYLLGTIVAKNVFCAVCNHAIHGIPTFNLDGLCLDSVVIKERGSAITFLIDYSSLSADPLKEETKCDSDELFDKFTGICRKLLCPMGTAPFHGRCKQLVSQVTGWYIEVPYYLDMTWNHTSLFTDYGKDTIGEEIFTQFMEIVDLNSNCKFCYKRIEMTDENVTSDLILILTLKIESGCDYGLLFTELAGVRDKVIEILINRTTVLSMLARSDQQSSTIPIKLGPQTIFFRYVDNCFDSVYSLSFDDLTCPRLEMNYTELELFSPSDKKNRDAFSSFFISSGTEQNVTRVYVCLDTYLSVMSQLNSALPIDGKMTIQFLPSVLFVLTLTLY